MSHSLQPDKATVDGVDRVAVNDLLRKAIIDVQDCIAEQHPVLDRDLIARIVAHNIILQLASQVAAIEGRGVTWTKALAHRICQTIDKEVDVPF